MEPSEPDVAPGTPDAGATGGEPTQETPPGASDSATVDAWYAYAIVRVVPRVERGECLNVGVVLFARTARFLEARFAVDPARLRALAPGVDLDLVERHLETFVAICAGRPEGGPVSALPPPERFHWLTAPRSTIIQTSPVHEGHSADLTATLEHLLDAYVRVPRAD